MSYRYAVILSSMLFFATGWAQLVSTPARNAETDFSEWNPIALASDLESLPAGFEHDFYAGGLASMRNQLDESIRLLTHSLPALEHSNPKHAALALETLGDDYRRQGRYAKQADTWKVLLRLHKHDFSPDEIQAIQEDLVRAEPLRHVPQPSVTWTGPARLKTNRNPLDTVEVALTVNGQTGPWMLDTGAAYSAVSESFARRLGLHILKSVGNVPGSAGAQNAVRWTVIPEVPFGGAVLHNVVALVFKDANLHMKTSSAEYQIHAALGAPVFLTLGRMTFDNAGYVTAEAKGTDGADAAAMYMNGLTPVIEGTVATHKMLFSLDTGAAYTSLNDNYYKLFQAELASAKRDKQPVVGAGGSKEIDVVRSHVAIQLGERSTTLQDVPVAVSQTNDSVETFGTIGQDLLQSSRSYTIDLRSMTFHLGEPLP